MMSFSVKQIILVGLFQIFGLICIPVSLFGIYKLYVHKHESFVIKRQKSLILLKLISFMIFQIVSYIGGTIFSLIEYSGQLLVYDAVILISLLSCLFAALLPSNWLTLYLNNWSIEMSNKKWKYIIIGNNTDNWFIKHRNTYGSWKYIGKYLIISVIIIGGVSNVSAGFAMKNMLEGKIFGYLFGCSITCILLSIPVVALVVIIKKIPVFKDSYFMREEHSRNIKISVILMVCTCAVPVHLGISIIIMKVPIYIAGIDSCVWSCLVWIGIGCMYVVSMTIMVIKDNISTKLLELNKIHNNSPTNKALLFSDVLKNEEILESFVSQLIKEIAIENMMSFIEFNQFIQHIYNTSNTVNSDHKTGMHEQSL